MKLSTRCAGSGLPRRCRTRSADTCVLLGATWQVICRWLLLVLDLEVPRRGY